MKQTDLTFIPEFYDRYIALVNRDTDVLQALKHTVTIFDSHTEALIAKEAYRYQPEKWTPKEMLQHIIDTERIFSYRALAISRQEQQHLIGFDENAYAKNSKANYRTVESLLKEFKLVRQSTIALFESFDNDIWHLEGICSDKKMSVLAIGFVITGHAMHHLNILNERYFVNL
ncbi:DinB family protein [Flavobacteriaceae bacterium MHTCC 0001]